MHCLGGQNVLILFLSKLDYDIEKEELRVGEEYNYKTTEKKIEVSGFLSNVAPAKFVIKKLLLDSREPLSKIIAITTPQGNNPEQRDDAWRYYQREINTYIEKENSTWSKPKYISIPYKEGDELFIYEVVKQIEKADQIYLDITGGFRDTIMHLLALTRILKTRKNYVEQVVFADVNSDQKKREYRIVDRTKLYHMFDLISGADEFIHYGSVKTLKYFFENAEEEVKDAIQAMEQFSQNLKLCRSSFFAGDVELLKSKIGKQVQFSNQLFSEILEPIQESYEAILKKDSSLLDQIEWCLKNDMLQQAITFYVEGMPKFFDQNRIFLNFELNLKSITKELSKKRKKTTAKDLAKKALKNGKLKSFLKEEQQELAERLVDLFYSIKFMRNNIHHASEKKLETGEKTLGDWIESNIRESISCLKEYLLEDASLFINLTNHPFATWREKQKEASLAYGRVVDFPFPVVSPSASTEELKRIASKIVEEIIERKPAAVLCHGETTLCFLIVSFLLRENITVLAACTDRNVKEEIDQQRRVKKTSYYEFVQYREYNL